MAKWFFIAAVIYFVYKLIKSRGTILFNKAAKLINNGNYDDGLKLLEKAVDAGIPPIHRVRAAFAELKFGDVDKVPVKLNMIFMDPSVKADIKNEARCVMAVYYIIKRQFQDAVELMEKVHENFQCTRFYQTYGYLALLTGDDEFIKRANEEAYEYNKDDAVICDNYGLYLIRGKRFDEAEELYKNALEKERNFPEIYYNYATVLIEKGDTHTAKEMLEKALEKPFFNNTTVKKQAVEGLLSTL